MSRLEQTYRVEFLDHTDRGPAVTHDFSVIDMVELFDRLLGSRWSWALDEPGGTVKITRTG